MSLLDIMLRRIVRHGRLTVTHAGGRVVHFGAPAPGFPEVAIRFTDGRVAGEILRDPRLGAAEAFMDGRLVIDQGDIMALVGLLRANQPWDKGGQLAPPRLLRRLRGAIGHAVASFNHAASARRNVAHHYDIGNTLYRMMLDADHMQYSCAYWPRPDMTLEQAQEAKLAHIAAKLLLAPGQHVLDIGCGWGGMAIYLARHAGVQVTGITLSREQLDLANERVRAAGLGDRVSLQLVDYRELAEQGQRFDRIVSVGMFEHVGQPQFETFFRACASMLDDDGVMLLHTIGRLGTPGRTDDFTRKYIFPGGYIPALSETLAASEKVRLIATDIETLRLHYARTLREWYARCLANRGAIVGLFDERFFRMWTFYLAGATAAFEHGGMGNYQVQFARSRHAVPLTRDYMAQAEARLLS